MNPNLVWQIHLNSLLKAGKLADPRGLRSYEILNKAVTFDTTQPVIENSERRLNYKFMAAEALWILSGSNLLAPIYKVCRPYAKFSDDGIHMNGAYGPKIVDQLEYVTRTLEKDQFSRQAVINLWRERPMPSKDIPCTLSMQFLIRKGFLHNIVTMRSSDAWLGLPYDLFTFSMITQTVAALLDMAITPGDLHINMGSAHFYETDAEGVKMASLAPSKKAPIKVHLHSTASITHYLEGIIKHGKAK